MKENTRGKDPRAAAAKFSLQKIYIKDVSFESPRPVEWMLKPIEGANADFHLSSESRRIEGDVYEVVLTITVTVSRESKVLYLIEVKQAGLFVLTGLQAEELAGALNVYCPSILFPYAREVVSSMAESGGFPQLLLKPANFDLIYRQYLEKSSQAAVPGQT